MLVVSVHGECYSRNAWCALNLISNKNLRFGRKYPFKKDIYLHLNVIPNLNRNALSKTSVYKLSDTIDALIKRVSVTYKCYAHRGKIVQLLVF
jgi:hypothetical protein